MLRLSQRRRARRRRRPARRRVRRSVVPAQRPRLDRQRDHAAVDAVSDLDAVRAAGFRCRLPTPGEPAIHIARWPGPSGRRCCSAPKAPGSPPRGSPAPTPACASRCDAGADSLNVATAAAIAFCERSAGRLVADDPAVVEFEPAGQRDRVEQRAVVRDEEQRALVVRERRFELFDRRAGRGGSSARRARGSSRPAPRAARATRACVRRARANRRAARRARRSRPNLASSERASLASSPLAATKRSSSGRVAGERGARLVELADHDARARSSVRPRRAGTRPSMRRAAAWSCRCRWRRGSRPVRRSRPGGRSARA